MAKNSITDYSKTASSNTDIQSVDIDEGCAPSGINNAIRELMTDLAEMNDGTVSLTSPSFAAASLTGNLSFGDNNKAIFGAGSDLEIYHNGTDSFIDEKTSGWLYIRANDMVLGKYTGETYVKGIADGAVELYHDNTKRMETTSTGVDVTGTVTSDGLTVNGNVEISSSNALLYFMESDTTDKNSVLQSNAGLFRIQTVNDAKNTFTERFRIDHATGNVTLNAGGTYRLDINAPTATSAKISCDNTPMEIGTHDNHDLKFITNNTEDMRLETDGDLHVDGNVIAYSTTISDIRLKKDIAPIEDAVTKVQQLNGCTFTYLKDDRKSAGLIAQDVEKVLPSAVIDDEAVFHGEEGETYKTVQYDQLIGLLVEAVKELKAEIEELKDASSK